VLIYHQFYWQRAIMRVCMNISSVLKRFMYNYLSAQFLM